MRSSIKNTAFGVAKTRCVEMFYAPEHRLFDDAYSIQLLPPVTRMLTSMMRWKRIREFVRMDV
jgi:O-methyltransferase involved in polyketide biosynthesis